MNWAGRQGPTAWPTPRSSASATRAQEGLRRADIIADYVRTAPVVAEPFTNPPGYNSVGANVAMLKAGPRAHRMVTDRNGVPIDHRTATVEQFMDTETVFAGTPDDVFNQLKAFNQRMGGVGHLLFFGQGGQLTPPGREGEHQPVRQGGGATADGTGRAGTGRGGGVEVIQSGDTPVTSTPLSCSAAQSTGGCDETI